MRILAIDLGKGKSVACIYSTTDRSHEFKTVSTQPLRFLGLLEATEPDRVVIEISPLAGWVGDLVRAMDIPLQVANTNGDAWKWKNVNRKTDRDDALKLAQMSASDELPEVHLPAPRVRAWRSLIHYRQTLVARRTSTKNRIRAILDRQGLQLAAGKTGWSKKRIAELTEHARPIAECEIDDLWRGELHEELEHLAQFQASLKRVTDKLDKLGGCDRRVQRLRSIPAVGPRLAEAVVAAIDDPHRFANGKQVAAYAGLTPRLFQSGQMERHGRITGRGNKELRKLLVEVSWIGLRLNPRMREVYHRICRGSRTRKKIAIVAVARRLLIWCWALLRDDGIWKGDPTRSSATGKSVSKAA